MRAKKAPDVTPATEQMRQLSKQSVNKTDEDKVKDEIKDLKEYQARLERVCFRTFCNDPFRGDLSVQAALRINFLFFHPR